MKEPNLRNTGKNDNFKLYAESVSQNPSIKKPPITDLINNLAEKSVFVSRCNKFFTQRALNTFERAINYYLKNSLITKRMVGDIGEPTSVSRIEILRDDKYPWSRGDKYAQCVVNTFLNSQIINILSIIDERPLDLCHAMVNRLGPGDFIGKHIDRDSNPNLVYFVVVIPESDNTFNGGEFVVSYRGKKDLIYAVQPGDLIIGHAQYPHHVQPVIKGYKNSLAFFLEPKSIDPKSIRNAEHAKAIRGVVARKIKILEEYGAQLEQIK